MDKHGQNIVSKETENEMPKFTIGGIKISSEIPNYKKIITNPS